MKIDKFQTIYEIIDIFVIFLLFRKYSLYIANKRYRGNYFCVPSMALILLVQVQSRVFTAKCSEPQVGISNGMDAKNVCVCQCSYKHRSITIRRNS